MQTKVAKSGDTLTGMVTEISAPRQSTGVVGNSWGAVLPAGVAEPTYDFVTSPNTQCPGVGQATAGRLCVYVISQLNRNDGYEHVFGDVWNATIDATAGLSSSSGFRPRKPGSAG